VVGWAEERGVKGGYEGWGSAAAAGELVPGHRRVSTTVFLAARSAKCAVR
jgi:hypothetical protein